MRSRSRRRVWYCLAASFLIHLLLLLAYQRMADWHRRQQLRPTRYLPDLVLLAPQLFRRQAIPRLPEREMEPAPAPPVSPVPLPWLVAPEPEPTAGRVEPPAADTVRVLGARPPVFLAQPELGDFRLNERQIEAVRKLREEYDRYARYWAPDVDTTDVESARRARAEAVVARAFEAMGGLDRLLKITRMRVLVWVVASETLGPRGQVRDLPPYPYPIAVWRMRGLDQVERLAFRSALDLGSGRTFPAYLTRNPALSRRAYYLNFDGRWRVFAPEATRRLRLRAERARWHLVDQFLGEGIRLAYLHAGRLDPGDGVIRPVHQIRVDDRKYGRRLDAFFDRDTGLLLATRETLSAIEASWYRQKENRRAPTWTTRYDRYREVAGVLLPHRWVRTVSSIPKDFRIPRWEARMHGIDLRLNIAVNGADPDTAAPGL